MPKPTKTSMACQTYKFVRSAHRRMLTPRERIMSSPPMVGVPAFDAWAATSSRMYWPHLSLRSQMMNFGPMRMLKRSAVMSAAMERKVM